MIPAARIALHRICTYWEDLDEQVGVAATACWPPQGLKHYLSSMQKRDDLEERAALRALERDPAQLGETQAPISITTLDAMQEVTAALVECADQVASRVQRPSMSQRYALAAQDAADPRRWRYVGQRSAVEAARWLDARLAGEPGPFAPLPSLLIEHIARVAQAASATVLRALELSRESRAVDRPCPVCHQGRLRIAGGDGTPPTATCLDCGRQWREAVPA